MDPDEFLLRRRRRPRATLARLMLAPVGSVLTIVLLMYALRMFEQVATELPWLPADLTLPRGTGSGPLVGAASVAISRTAIFVNGRRTIELVDWQPMAPDGSLAPLLEALEEHVVAVRHITQTGGDPFDGSLNLYADMDTPSSLISAVVGRAHHAGFTTVSFVSWQVPR